MGEEHRHDDRDHSPDSHERLPHADLVGEQPGNDDRQRVDSPEPVADAVRLGLAVAEDRREVDDEDPDRREVEQEEGAHSERWQHDPRREHLAQRLCRRCVDVDASSPRLDDHALSERVEDLISKSWRELAQREECQHEDHQADAAGNVELILPGVQDPERARGDDSDDQAGDDWTKGPEAHRCPPSDLRREVAHQRRCGHQHDTLEEAERDGEARIRALRGGTWDAHEGDQTCEEEADHDDVGTTEAITEPRKERRDGPEGTRHHGDGDVVPKGHVEVRQDRGRH